MKTSVSFASMSWVLRKRAEGREVGHKSFGLWRRKGGIWEVVITAWDSELYFARHKASRIRTVSKTSLCLFWYQKYRKLKKILVKKRK